MTGNSYTEIERAALVTALGVERAQQLFPLEPARALDPAPGVDLASISAASLGATMDAYRGLNYSRLDGSNNWVVSGSITASGKPLLANDPHRSITTPSLRYLTHLVGPGWNVIGAGEPGVPGVAAGHNERVGFGFTIVGMDQQDVYVERLGRCPNGSENRCYMGATGWRPVRTIVDTIRVKDAGPKVVKLEFTEHGPIVSEDSTGRGYVIRFVGSEPGTAGYLAQLSINRAHNWESFKAATDRWRLPTENLIYADVDGNIGWVAAGLMPIRSWSGMLPVPGNGGYEWQGFLPFSELPLIVQSAGRVHRDREPQHPAAEVHQAARLRVGRAVAVPADLRGVCGPGRTGSGRTSRSCSTTRFSIPARELVPLLLEACRKAGTTGPALDVMSKWDYVMRADAAAPLLFAVWLDSLSTRAMAQAAGDKAAELKRMGITSMELPMVLTRVKEPGGDELLTGSFAAAATVVRDRYGCRPGALELGQRAHGGRSAIRSRARSTCPRCAEPATARPCS